MYNEHKILSAHVVKNRKQRAFEIQECVVQVCDAQPFSFFIQEFPCKKNPTMHRKMHKPDVSYFLYYHKTFL